MLPLIIQHSQECVSLPEEGMADTALVPLQPFDEARQEISLVPCRRHSHALNRQFAKSLMTEQLLKGYGIAFTHTGSQLFAKRLQTEPTFV